MFDFAVTQDVKALRETFRRKDLSLYFLGIGGVGMSALAEHFHLHGAIVAGCDRAESECTRRLRAMGIPITVGQGSIPRGTHAVIYTLAFPVDSAELKEAGELGIRAFPRPVALGALMTEYKNRIGVCGTHGKSSTVAMLSGIYSHLEMDATVISGADLGGGSSYLGGGPDTLIYEACEYRDAFLSFSPTSTVITGVELDHTDYFPDLSSLLRSFGRVADSTSGRVIINIDDSGAATLVGAKDKYITVGKNHTAKYRYLPSGDGTASFRLYRGEDCLGEVKSPLIGEFFATDMALAAACAIEEGLPPDGALHALSKYRGTHRRLQRIAEYRGIPVFYDYAHHPTEMRAVIGALRARFGRVTVVFCPHTYTRTSSLWDGFVSSLRGASSSIILDVFAAREEPIPGVDSPSLAKAVGEGSHYLADGDVLGFISTLKQDVIVFMGAGNMDMLIKEVMESRDK